MATASRVKHYIHIMASLPTARQNHDLNVNVTLRALCREGRLKEATHILFTATSRHPPPLVDSSTCLQLLETCIANKALAEGKLIHSHINDTRHAFTPSTHVFLESKLIHLYVKCASLTDARNVFDRMTERDVFLWNMIISAYQRYGFPRDALTLFHQMQQTEKRAGAAVHPNQFTFPSILQACAKLGDLQRGLPIHQIIIKTGFFSDVVVASALIDMYAKCGSIHIARELFDKMPQRGAESWNAMITGYAKYGLIEQARELFDKFANRDVITWTSMIAGYAQNGLLEKGRELFDKMSQRSAVSWNAMIAGYAQNGLPKKALDVFKQMQLAGVKPSSATFASILPACAKTGSLEEGMDIHQRIIESAYSSDVVIVSALIDMYAKCGAIQKARDVFDKMPHRDEVSWTAMIAGYAQNGIAAKALEIFKQMLSAGVKPSSAIFATILPACAKMGALQQGMDIHKRIVKSGFLSDVTVMSALIDMYAKCGSIHKAHKLFHKMAQLDAVSWTAMIAGYAMHGYSKDALKLFEQMKLSGTNPNHVSFLCVLFACNHAGLVDEGCKYFNNMSDSYRIMPTMDHYVCMVDLLGRAGYLEEAINFLIKMPIKPEVVMWICLLGACRSHKNIGLGEYVATHVLVLEPKNAASYILLSNIYAEVGRWGNVQKVRKLMKDRGIKKKPGCSWIEVHKMVHTFL